MNHITPEQAASLAVSIAVNLSTSDFMHALCNAAIQHYIDSTAQVQPGSQVFDCYDAGLLGDFGGGNVEWWQDYIRSELARAHDFYQSQPPAQPVSEPALPVNWAAMIHYPDCWDTAAYPELRDAIHEALAWSGCSVCKPSAPTGEGA
jgi:hypothetical protein